MERRLKTAERLRGPAADAAWQDVYEQLADDAPAVPLVTRRSATLISERVGNYQHHPLFGVLYDQLSVR